ncbi:MAG TPA: divalent metal cation transporter [Chloroflexota bacterium]|nr:divalent metal cation transporter [Chloroflexota bacterium]
MEEDRVPDTGEGAAEPMDRLINPAATGIADTGLTEERAESSPVFPVAVSRSRLTPLARARRLVRAVRIPRVGPLAYLAALGPGLIAANAGNDAGGIATYSSVGASYGYGLLWMMVVITLSLGVVQEMCARMGAVTGKGLSALIREYFGLRLVAFAMLALLIANGGTAISEFVGIGAALGLVGLAPALGVPLIAALVWWLVARGSYRRVEVLFLVMTLAFLSYPISAILAHPNWGQVARQAVVPSFQLNATYIFTFVATVGTTITPYMQIYVQSSVAEKDEPLSHYKYERADVYTGSIFSNLIAGLIIVCTGATLYVHHIQVTLADDAARALVPFVGQYAKQVFAVGLFGASMLAAAVLPLATSYSLTEAFGLERGVDKRLAEAPVFWGIFTGLIALGAVVGVLIPRTAVVHLLLVVQVVNGVLLPVLLIFIIRLINNREIMGDYVNGRVYNALAWATVVVVAGLSTLMVVTTVLPALGLHLFGL